MGDLQECLSASETEVELKIVIICASHFIPELLSCCTACWRQILGWTWNTNSPTFSWFNKEGKNTWEKLKAVMKIHISLVNIKSFFFFVILYDCVFASTYTSLQSFFGNTWWGQLGLAKAWIE